MTYNRHKCTITLSPIEQRYISTCYPLPDRPFLDEASAWKEKLRKSSSGDVSIDVEIDKIGRAFPHIGMLHRKGFFGQRSIQSYFEGVDADSHNMRMYLFARKIARSSPPEEVLLSILKHIEHCSVRIGNLDSSVICSYGMSYEFPLDNDYFNIRPQSEHVIVHGRSDKGAIVVSDVLDEDFMKFKCWFEARQSSNENPFVKYKNRLEALL